MLRDYQQRSVTMLYDWFASHDSGNPCLVLPTGAGKSHVIAHLCRDALQNWPETRILMLTHQKELIAQNAEKLREHWRGAPVGIYSASLRQKTIHAPITFAGIQSIGDHAKRLGHVDIVLVDECHLINNSEVGTYRRFLSELESINPRLRVVGLTATPYRLGHGMIHEGEDALFCDLIEPVTIEELVHRGFLAPLRSKHTEAQLDTDGVGKRGGEFIPGALERAVDRADVNRAVVAETIVRAHDRHSWLFFCAGVDHAEHIAEELTRQGVTAACVTGKTPQGQRDQILRAYKAGELLALTNANVLTTGFDAPNTDCLVMLRPTMSPGLYVQMAGRGMRLKTTGAKDCLVLDFAGNVATHGPITCVEPPSKRGKAGKAPVKTCPSCSEVVSVATRLCPSCGHQWPPPEEQPPKPMRLHDDDIMGNGGRTMAVTGWSWRVHVSRVSGLRTLLVTYYGPGLTDAVQEYVNAAHEGEYGQRQRAMLAGIAAKAGAKMGETLEDMCTALNAARHPVEIEYRKDGRFYVVKRRIFENISPEPLALAIPAR